MKLKKLSIFTTLDMLATKVDNLLLTDKLKIGLKDWFQTKRKPAIFFSFFFIVILLQAIMNILIFLSQLLQLLLYVTLIIVFFLFSFLPHIHQAYQHNIDYYTESSDKLQKSLSHNPQDQQNNGTNTVLVIGSLVTGVQVAFAFILMIFSPLHDILYHAFPMVTDLHFSIPSLGLHLNIWSWVKFLLMIMQGIIYFIIVKYIKRLVWRKTNHKLKHLFSIHDFYDKKYFEPVI